MIRVVDGREIEGRFVSPRAYALYARGAEAEARGELEGARLEYLAAASDDGGSAEIWTRIGAVTCALGRADESREAFGCAAERAPDYQPLYRERAVCALSQARVAPEVASAAFEDAKRALALDPDDEDSALLYARAAEAAGHPGSAELLLRELVVRSPGRVAGWAALRDLARRRGDLAAVARAEISLRALSPASTPWLAPGAGDGAGAGARPASSGGAAPAVASGGVASGGVAPGALAEIDAALARDALSAARKAATRARLPPAELAVRAAALGRAAVAKEQATLVFNADPGSASAAIALAVACDLLHDDAGLSRALSDTSSRTTPPSALARLLFAELIARRTSADAAATWLGSVPPSVSPAQDPAGTDALLLAVSTRVTASLKP
ncbi:MAG: hypothetical protein R3F14_10210 [Polyangiaceae bacterium]